MLTSLIIAYFLLHSSGASGYTAQLDRITKAVKENVTVEATRTRALAILDTASKANSALVEAQKKDVSALEKVLANRTATAAEIDGALAPLRAADSTGAQRLLDASFKLRATLSAAEWSKVFPPPAEKPAAKP